MLSCSLAQRLLHTRMTSARRFHPLEYLHAMNIPIFSSTHKCALRRFADMLSFHEVQQLAGNGMNLAAVGAVLLFALAGSEVLPAS